MNRNYYKPITGEVSSTETLKNLLGSKAEEILYRDSGLVSLGLFNAYYVDNTSDYNPYTHKISDSTSWVEYNRGDSLSGITLVEDTPEEDGVVSNSILITRSSFYVGTNVVVPLVGSELSDAQDSAKGIVQKEVLKRLDEVTTLQSSGYDRTELETYKNQLTNLYLDSVYPSVIAHSLGGKDSGWPVAPTITLDSGTTSSGRLAQVYASWNGSTAGSYDWANDQLSSFGVDSVSRIQEGSFRVYFSNAFTDSNYTVTTGVGAENYGGANASPRQLTVIRSEMTPNYVTVHCERTDDAVDEDNEYMSVIVMGTQ